MGVGLINFWPQDASHPLSAVNSQGSPDMPDKARHLEKKYFQSSTTSVGITNLRKPEKYTKRPIF
jgi:hypothetical protein